MTDGGFSQRLKSLVPAEGADSYAFYDARARNPAAWDPATIKESSLRFFAALNEHANAPDDVLLDLQLADLTNLYLAAGPADRATLRQSISGDFCRSLLHFAHRAAVKALRSGSRNDVVLALGSLSIEDVRADLRETVGMLALIHHVCVKIGVDASTLFSEIAALSSERAAQSFSDFLRRPVNARDITLFAFRQGTSEFGPTLSFLSPWKGET